MVAILHKYNYFCNTMKKLLLPAWQFLARLWPRGAAWLRYLLYLRRLPHFGRPKDLNDKINYLKFHADQEQWAALADKFKVRGYVRERGLEELLVPLYGKYDTVEELRSAWPSLPGKFVLKSNNGSSAVRVIGDKASENLDEILSEAHKWLTDNRFWTFYVEPHYRLVKPCIIAEQLLEDPSVAAFSRSLIDYKIWCFDGRPHCIWACYDRAGGHAYVQTYSPDWTPRPEVDIYGSHYRKAERNLPAPVNLQKMLECASILSKGLPQVRTDLYNIGGKIYFGELTLSSNGGYNPFYTRSFLRELGDLCNLG